MPSRHRREATAGRHAPLIASPLGKRIVWHCAGTGGIHQSIRQLRPDPWPRSLLWRLPVGHSAGAWNPAIQVPAQENYPRMGVAAISKACAVWRFGNSREAGYRIPGTDQSLLATSDSATIISWALWAADAAVDALLGRRRSRQ